MTLIKPCLNCDEMGETNAFCVYENENKGLTIRVFECHRCDAQETIVCRTENLK